MKIAHLVSTFYPRLGGMGAVVYEEAKELAVLGHAVTVFTMRYPGTAERETFNGFNVERTIPLIRWGDGGLVFGLAEKLKEFDIVHVHYPWVGGAEEAWRSYTRYQKKFIVTFHMEAAPKGAIKRIVNTIYNSWYGPKILRAASMVAVVDKEYFVKSQGAKNVDTGTVVTLENPVDTQIFKPRAASWKEFELEYLNEKKVLLFVANLMPVKRLDLLLRTLKDNLPDIELVVVGSGYAENDFKNLSKQLGLEKRVHWLGAVLDRDKLAKLYNLVNAVVIPSSAESFSLVALEALAAGCPVIASKIPGLKSRIAEGVDGFFFKPGSKTDLAAAITKVLQFTPAQKTSFAESGEKKVNQNYSLQQHVDKLLTLYAKVTI